MPIVVPDPSDASTFMLAGRPVPQRTSDWMRLLVIVLSYVALRDPFVKSMFYIAQTPADHPDRFQQDSEPVPQQDMTAFFSPLAPVFPVSPQHVLYAPVEASALLILHPAGIQATPDLEEPDGLPVAVGALLLPGMPQLGLDHRAAWAAVSIDGEIANMNYTSHAKLTEHQDIAVLSVLLSDNV